MKCISCGSEIPNESAFCSFCGKEQKEIEELDTHTEQRPESIEKSSEASVTDGHSYKPNLKSDVCSDKQLGMKWYNFIIKFQLYASMVISILYSLQAFQGAQYDSIELVYTAFPTLKTADIFYAIALLLCAVYAFYTRRALANFERTGPSLYLGFLAANTAIPFVYVIFVATIIEVPIGALISGQMTVNLVISLILIVLNKVYFDKRKELFRYEHGHSKNEL